MTTLFTDRETTITASWLNSVDAIITDPAVTALAGVTPAADTLPYFTGTAAAALASLSSFIRTLLDDTDAATARTTLGAQPLDPELTALASVTSAADALPYFTGSGTAGVTTLTAFARTLLDDVNAASFLATVGAQPLDAELTALASVTSAADKVPYFTAASTAAVADFTAFGRSLVDDANAAAGLATLGAAPLASPTFTGTPAAPTAAVDTNTTQLATTAFVIGQAYAKLASPTFTGTPAAPTAAADTNTTQLATTAFVIGQAYAKLASPTFTGTVTLPTVTVGGAVGMTNNALNAAKVVNFNGIIDDGNSSTSDTIDFGAGQYHKSTLTGNCAYTFTAPAGPCVVQLEMIQSGGANTYTTSPVVKWPASYAAADKLLSTAAGARDLMILRWNGTDYVANLIKGIA